MNDLKSVTMKNISMIILGIIILLNISLIDADGNPSEINIINLYMSGDGGGPNPTSQSGPPGNLTTISPTSTSGEYENIYLSNVGFIPEDIYWFSEPLKSDIIIRGDVTFSIWVVCSAPRYISIITLLEIQKSSGEGHGYGTSSEAKLVYDEPVEFNNVLTEETIADELKNYNYWDLIGIGLSVELIRPQPPAEVTILYNSSNHPSHMTINTKSVFIDIYNQTTTRKKLVLDLSITSAFGYYDIADYSIQIEGPSGKSITKFEIIEYNYPDHGIIIPRLVWDQTEDISGNYTVIVTVIDNNNNKWEEVERNEFKCSDQDSMSEILPNLLIFLGIGVILAILLFIYVSRKRKKRKLLLNQDLI